MVSYRESGDIGWLERVREPYECPYVRKQREIRERVDELDSELFFTRIRSQDIFSRCWISHLLRTSQFPWRDYVTFTNVKWGEVLFNLKVNVSSSLGGRRLEWTFDKFSNAKTKTRFYSFRTKKPNTVMHHSCPRECIFCDGTFPGCGHYLSLSPEAFEAEKLKHANFKAKAKAKMVESRNSDRNSAKEHRCRSFHLCVGIKYLIREARREGNPI